jgi:hypothetical protein
MNSSRLDRRDFLKRLAVGIGAAGLSARDVTAVAQARGNSIGSSLELRKEELRRRVASLPGEVIRWTDRARKELDENLHFSQLQALKILMDAITKDQLEMVQALKPEGDEGEFLRQSLDLVDEIIRAQGVWDFYRDKLQLRFSPDFKESLRVADIVAWDCYHPVLERAASLDILPRSHMREPPLCYYTADFSPATRVRSSRIQDLHDPNKNLLDSQGAEVRTPIPVIELPWDHAANLWEFLSIPHEVGHDLEADLKLRTPLLQSLDNAIKDGRRKVWRAWQAETFADLIALQLVGPAFAEALMNLLLLPKSDVTKYNADDPHPTHYLRIRMAAAYIRTLFKGDGRADDRQREELSKHADQIETVWKRLYGDPPELRKYICDFPQVFKALMDQPLEILKKKSVRSLIPFEAGDDSRIRDASKYLETGQNRPAEVPARHCLAAARLAVTRSGQEGKDLKTKLEDINKRTGRLVNDNAPKGLLAGIDDEHRHFIAGFAKTISVKKGGRRSH